MTSPISMPLEISFRHLESSQELESQIREKVEKLRQFHPDIRNCHVMVEQLNRHHHPGQHFHVRIDLKVTGHTLISGREPDLKHSCTDVHTALRDAFKAMRRKLEDLARHQQGRVKHHEERPHGHITEISADKTFGRIESVDGRWLYFHRNSLLDEDLNQLHLSTPVYFVEDTGHEGPQASSVYPVGKHHILI